MIEEIEVAITKRLVLKKKKKILIYFRVVSCLTFRVYMGE